MASWTEASELENPNSYITFQTTAVKPSSIKSIIQNLELKPQTLPRNRSELRTGCHDSSFSACPWFWWCVLWLILLQCTRELPQLLTHHKNTGEREMQATCKSWGWKWRTCHPWYGTRMEEWSKWPTTLFSFELFEKLPCPLPKIQALIRKTS